MDQNVETTRKEIGNRVKNMRIKKGWTDEVLGQQIGISGSTLNNKERGIRDFTWNEIIALSDKFGVTIDELVRGMKPENLAAHRKTGLSNDSINALRDFYESKSLKKIIGLNRALSSNYVLDALAGYMSFFPKEKGYYLSEIATYEHDRFIECRMSQQLYFNVLGQNLLQVLNEARRQNYDSRRLYRAIEDFLDLPDDAPDEAGMAEPSAFEQPVENDNNSDHT